jgi:hypothetical protein
LFECVKLNPVLAVGDQELAAELTVWHADGWTTEFVATMSAEIAGRSGGA